MVKHLEMVKNCKSVIKVSFGHFSTLHMKGFWPSIIDRLFNIIFYPRLKKVECGGY